ETRQSEEAALKRLLSGIDLKKSKTIVVINSPQTDMKTITAPYMPKSELREGVRLAAKNYFPFPVDESFLDFEILGDIVDGGVKKYEIAVAASPKKTANKYLSLLQKAGIKPASLVPASYALKKAAEGLCGNDDRSRCFIDIGKTYAELIILKGKHQEFIRKIPVAGDDFTKALTQVLASDRGRLELSFSEAENIKLETGIPSGTETKIIGNKISTAQIKSMLMTPLENLTGEVGRCFDYYRELSKGAKIDSVVLFGGGSFLGGLVKSLSEGLGIDVKLGDSARFELAMGAAMSSSAGVNLLPLEIKEASKVILRRGAFEAVATALVLISVLVYIGLKIKLNSLDKRISAASLELSRPSHFRDK
ncbi:MAG: pilus assembly protein PilM, partial [Candidatus Omnitrophica bacterium]|nr:pilus assembly protein PilM [Candidatus Omnitrophota bacterium]